MLSVQPLSIGDTVEFQVDNEPGKTFSVLIEDSSKMITITCDPMEQNSDTDLYVKYNEEVSITNFDWKSLQIGRNRVVLSQQDQKFQPGQYYIGVFPFKQGQHSCKLTINQAPVAQHIQLEEEWIGTIEKVGYYQFEIKNAGQSRLQIQCMPGRGSVQLFLSSAYLFPNQDNCSFCIGNDQLDYDFQKVQSLYHIIDPYQEQLPQVYTDNRIMQKLKLEQEQSCDFQFNDYDTINLCLDTDIWKYTQKNCYLAIQNCQESPLDIIVKIRETTEIQMIDTQILPKFNYFNSVFKDIDGGLISTEERERLNISSKVDFTYGEVELMHLIPLIEICQPIEGEVFWDLGSGTGKCLLCASLFFPQISIAKGVEYLPELCRLSQQIIQNIQCEFPLSPIEIIQGDLNLVDWSDADIVFSSSICFVDDQMVQLYQKALSMKKGSRFITLKQFPKNKEFELVVQATVKMTWGKTEAYILRKVV